MPLGILMGVLVILMNFITNVWVAAPFLIMLGAIAGFMVVPMNALLQHRGHNLMGAGRSIAVQNFNEQACILGLGAFYSLFNRISLVKLDYIEGNCVHCLACVPACPTGVRAYEERDSRECILCLRCVQACRFGALDFSLRRPLPAPRKTVARAVEPPKRVTQPT